DIAAVLHARFSAEIHSRAMGGDYPLSRLLTGNAAEGKAFFNGAGGCADCHSVSGDLAHVAKKYEPVVLETRMLYPRGAATPTVTVTLPSGEQLKGKLEHLDEFSVALRDAAGWYRSFSRSQVHVEVHDPLAAHRELLSKLTQDDVHNLFAYLETLQ
ncbi:MAG: c-type cytochrome, partial [Terriglobia bacterium]